MVETELDLKCKEIKSGSEGSAEHPGAPRVERQAFLGLRVPSCWPVLMGVGHHLLVKDSGMKQPQPCGLVYKLVRKRRSARGTKWLLFSFQTLIWPSCFLSFPEFVFLVLAETPAHMDSADPGPETSLTVSCCGE